MPNCEGSDRTTTRKLGKFGRSRAESLTRAGKRPPLPLPPRNNHTRRSNERGEQLGLRHEVARASETHSHLSLESGLATASSRKSSIIHLINGVNQHDWLAVCLSFAPTRLLAVVCEWEVIIECVRPSGACKTIVRQH